MPQDNYDLWAEKQAAMGRTVKPPIVCIACNYGVDGTCPEHGNQAVPNAN